MATAGQLGRGEGGITSLDSARQKHKMPERQSTRGEGEGGLHVFSNLSGGAQEVVFLTMANPPWTGYEKKT